MTEAQIHEFENRKQKVSLGFMIFVYICQKLYPEKKCFGKKFLNISCFFNVNNKYISESSKQINNQRTVSVHVVF